jgi:hypothetical protein
MILKSIMVIPLFSQQIQCDEGITGGPTVEMNMGSDDFNSISIIANVEAQTVQCCTQTDSCFVSNVLIVIQTDRPPILMIDDIIVHFYAGLKRRIIAHSYLFLKS